MAFKIIHPIHWLWKGLASEDVTFCVLVMNEEIKSTQPKPEKQSKPKSVKHRIMNTWGKGNYH